MGGGREGGGGDGGPGEGGGRGGRAHMRHMLLRYCKRMSLRCGTMRHAYAHTKSAARISERSRFLFSSRPSTLLSATLLSTTRHDLSASSRADF